MQAILILSRPGPNIHVTIKKKFACNPAPVDQNVHVHSGHIHVSFAFCQLF